MNIKYLILGLAALVVAGAAAAQSRLPPVNPGAIVRMSTGLNVTNLSDSTLQTGTYYQPPTLSPYSAAGGYVTGFASHSELGWLWALSGGGFTLMQTGYPGSTGGLAYVAFLTTGSCTPNANIVFSFSAPTGTPANTPSNITVATNASGQVPTNVKYVPSNLGSGYVSTPTISIASGGSCSTMPTFAYAITGTIGFGVPGDTTTGGVYRLTDDVCAAKPDMLIVALGTNDITQGVSFSQMVANYTAMIQEAQACGIYRILFAPITPRGIGQNGWTQAMDQQRLRINQWFRTQAALSSSANSGLPSIYTFDVDKYWSNAAATGTSAGTVVTQATQDYLHPSPYGAFLWAMAANYELRNLWIPFHYETWSQNDVYNATTCPNCNLIGTDGQFIGTGGSASGCTSGSVATDWNVGKSVTGSPTISVVCSFDNPRTDGYPGQRQKVVFSESSGGANDYIYLARWSIPTTNLTLGTDTIAGVVKIDISNAANVEYIGCQIVETATVNQSSNGLFGGAFSSTTTLPTSAQLATYPEATALPDWQRTGVGSFSFPCYMPPIKTQSNATAYAIQIYMNGNATSSFTGTVMAGPARIWKVTN